MDYKFRKSDLPIERTIDYRIQSIQADAQKDKMESKLIFQAIQAEAQKKQLDNQLKFEQLTVKRSRR